jgi:hypothetical protein
VRSLQVQTCPQFQSRASTARAAAVSTSASSSTMNGALPPSSSETTVMFSAEAARISLPARTEPVTVTSWVIGWRTSASPATRPAPVTTLTTPGGTPASSHRRARARALRGVSSCGFSTMVLPAMIAGATLRANSAAG